MVAISGILIGLASSAVAQEPAATAVEKQASLPPASLASHEDVNRWIEELGHDAFTVRQAAAASLLEAGMLSRESLVELANGPDPEKRAAARRLVKLIDQSEFHRRLEAFAADTSGRQGLTLPGWEQFQKLVGSDPAARELFVDMQRQEGALIAAILGGSKREPGELLESRLAKVVQWQTMGAPRSAAPPLGRSAALLFLGTMPEVQLSEGGSILVERLLQQPPISLLLRSEDKQNAVRRLGVAWLVHCPTKEEGILQHRLKIISSVGLAEALPLARAIIASDPPYMRSLPLTRAYAALAVGQLGSADDVERLEPMLLEAANCIPIQQQLPGQNASIQVRDAALVAMLQLTNQRPSDYGYLHARLAPPIKAYQLESLARESDGQRTEAIGKWHAWRAAQKKAAK